MISIPSNRKSLGTVSCGPALSQFEILLDTLVDAAKIYWVPRHDSVHKVAASVQCGRLEFEV